MTTLIYDGTEYPDYHVFAEYHDDGKLNVDTLQLKNIKYGNTIKLNSKTKKWHIQRKHLCLSKVCRDTFNYTVEKTFKPLPGVQLPILKVALNGEILGQYKGTRNIPGMGHHEVSDSLRYNRLINNEFYLKIVSNLF